MPAALKKTPAARRSKSIMAVGIGYRREMTAWDLSQVSASFFEVCPENWIRRDRTRLHEMTAAGRDVRLHGVSLNLGGTGPISTSFLHQVRDLMRELGTAYYSDHLAASGDAHQLYELFPIPFTRAEAQRVADRIAQVQDVLGCAIAVENSTYYTNVGDLRESEFLQEVVARSNCRVLLDVNNIVVNWKNHQVESPHDYLANVDLSKVSYFHVAGHEYNPRFEMYVDTHSTPVEPKTVSMAKALSQITAKDILLEWDNDVPALAEINRGLACLNSLITSEV
jgi:uncharacterized protein (UPF0276 family)